MLVSSVPLSETHMAGRPRAAMRASSSRTTRKPGRDVSATSARHSRVKSSTTVRIRTAGHRQVCPTGNPCSSADWAPAIKHRFARSAICALRYVTAPALPSWPDSLNNRSDRPDLREPARRLRRAPIKRASGESIEYLRTELSSLSQPYCLKKFSNKEKAVSLPKIA